MSPSTLVEKNIRVSFYAKAQNMPVSFHDGWGSGQLLSRMMGDINIIRRWIAFGMIMLVTTSVTIVVGMVLLIRSSWVLALVFFLAAVPVSIIAYRFNREFSILSRLSQDQNGDLATTIEQSVQGIRVLKAFGRGPTALEGFTAQADELPAGIVPQEDGTVRTLPGTLAERGGCDGFFVARLRRASA